MQTNELNNHELHVNTWKHLFQHSKPLNVEQAQQKTWLNEGRDRKRDSMKDKTVYLL